MKTLLKLSASVPENTSLAVIAGDEENMPVELTAEEYRLWQKKPEKQDTVFIQRLPHMLFLVKPDYCKPAPQVKEAFRKAGAAVMEILKNEKITTLAITGTAEHSNILAFLEGCLLAGYNFSRHKKEKLDFMPDVIHVINDKIPEGKLSELVKLTRAVWWARDLVNEPLSHLTAIQLAEEISKKGDEAGFSVEVFHKQKIESLKMGGLLAVNRGSPDPPTFTVAEHKPEGAVNERPVILVGKGVVFDTGGLSLKPTPKSMDYMKCDMAGAAAVAAVILAAAETRLPVWLIGLIPATDNRPDGNAFVPGDVITMYDGTTVEVLNTDAEGRLLLADALSYAKKYDPLLVIDLATLTGAASIIAGSQGIVAMGNTDSNLETLKNSGAEVYERLVELPLWDEYATALRSEVADMSNLGSREGQTIIAGKFLEHFTSFPWIHLDIAGTAWLFEKDSYRTRGGTGSGIRLLFDFLKKF